MRLESAEIVSAGTCFAEPQPKRMGRRVTRDETYSALFDWFVVARGV